MLESLESRRLMSALPAGVSQMGADLVVTAGSGAASIAVLEQDDGSLEVHANNLVVEHAVGVSRLWIYGSGGNDTIVVQQQPAANGPLQQIVVTAAKGNDSIAVDNTYATALIDAGDGNDDLVLENCLSVAPLMINGGKGDDTIMLCGGSGDRVFGDAGADRITVVGSDRASVSAGSGNDVVTLMSCTDANIDGGSGRDCLVTCCGSIDSTCSAVSNVEQRMREEA